MGLLGELMMDVEEKAIRSLPEGVLKKQRLLHQAIEVAIAERDKSWEQLMRQLIDDINKLPVYADTHNDGVMKGRTIDLIKNLIMGGKDGKKDEEETDN